MLLDKSCLKLQLDCETDSGITEEHIDRATKLGIDFGKSELSIQAQKYILPFFQKFLLLQEKLETGLLAESLIPLS